MKTRSIAGGLMAAAVLAAPLTAPAAYASGSPSAIADPNGSSLVVSADGVSGYTFRSTSDPFSAFNDQERGVLATMRILGPDGKAMDWFDPSVTGYHDVTSLELGVALGSADVKADGVTVAVGWYDQSGTKVGDHADEATLAKAVVFRATLTGDTSGASVSYTLVKKGATLPDSMRPGDVDGDGKYTANDLKDVQALFDGKPVDGFDPVKGGSYEVSGSGQVTLKNVPQNWKAIEGGDEKTASWTMTDPDGNKVVTYTFTAKSTKPDTKPGDVDGDGKYTAADLKNVKATADGTPVSGFDPVKGGTYQVKAGSRIEITGLPEGWNATQAKDSTSWTVTDPDGNKVVTYTFTAKSDPAAKPGDVDGDGKYTAADLKNVTMLVDGKPVDGFDPTKAEGSWQTDLKTGSKVTLGNIPDKWTATPSSKDGSTTYTVTDPDGDTVAVWTLTPKPSTSLKGDTDGDGKYTANDLKNVKATINGTPINGFNPTQNGTWHAELTMGSKLSLEGIPDGWNADPSTVNGVYSYTMKDPNGATVVVYKFTATITPAPGDADKSQLEALIAKAEALDLSKYTDESAANVTRRLNEAKELDAKDDAEQPAVDYAAKALGDAIDALKPKDTDSTDDALSKLTVTIDGEPAEGFDYKTLDYHVGRGGVYKVENVPDGWNADVRQTDYHREITLTDPKGEKTVYTFDTPIDSRTVTLPDDWKGDGLNSLKTVGDDLFTWRLRDAPTAGDAVPVTTIETMPDTLDVTTVYKTVDGKTETATDKITRSKEATETETGIPDPLTGIRWDSKVWQYSAPDGSVSLEIGQFAKTLVEARYTMFDGLNHPLYRNDDGTWSGVASTSKEPPATITVTVVNNKDLKEETLTKPATASKDGSLVYTSKDGKTTLTLHTNTTTPPDTKPGDVDGDGKYTANDLKNVKATADGTPVSGFDPVKGGTYQVKSGSRIEITGLPEGWNATQAKDSTSWTVTDPDGNKVVTYTFTAKSDPAAKPGDVDGDGKYTAADLKDVQALFDGKPVDGFDPVKGGSYEVSGSGQVTLKNVPQNWKAIEGGDEKTASWTMTDPDGNKVVTYTFTAKSTKPDTKPGDVDGDGKYTAADLKNVKATINGTPINGFNPTQNGTYKVEGSDPVALDGLPDGWTFTPATVDGTRTITVLDPDGDKVVTYTFTAESAKPDPDPDTKPDAKPGDADGDGKYTANDLKNVIVTVGGKRVDGFDPTRDGDYSASGDLKVDGLPNGWSTSSSDTAGGSVVTVTDPDGRRIVVWTFSAGSSSDGDDSSGNGQDGTGSGNGTSPSGSDSAPHDDSSKTGFLAQTGLTSPTGLVGLITVTVGAAAAFIVRLRRRHHED